MSGPDTLRATRLSVSQTVGFQLFIFMIVVYLNGYATSQNTGTRTKDYSNYTVYRVGLKTQEQLQQFLDYATEQELDIWRDPSGKVSSTDRDADIMVAPSKRLEFLNKMKAIGATVATLIVDVQSNNNETTSPMPVHQRSRLDMRTLNDPKYFRYSEIVDLLRSLEARYSDKVHLIDIGKTFEGRPMLLVYLSTDHRKRKPAIWIDAGIHAREWIAPSVAVQAIHKLATDPKAADLLDSVDWYILPVFNPDGYEYSHSVDRMWRKTRSKYPTSKCYGVDANRNFEYYWRFAGASSNPCSDLYAGPTFFSEPETKHARDFLLANKDQIKLYLTYHSYGKYLLYPWGYTSDLPENSDELDKLAREVNKSMVKAGSQPYKIGSSTNVLYAAAGGSDDWAKGVANISLAYTIELPGYGFGFQLPTDYINTVGDHAFVGMREFAKYLMPKTSNGPVRPITGASAGSRPIRPKPVYQGGSRPVSGTGNMPPPMQPSSSNASRPSRPTQTFQPAQSQPLRPTQSQPLRPTQSQPLRPTQSQPLRPTQSQPFKPAQSQPSRPVQSPPQQPSRPPQSIWIFQPQYIPQNAYLEHQPVGYYPYPYQFSPDGYNFGPNYRPSDRFYSSGYQSYPTVKATNSNPFEEFGNPQPSNYGQSYNDQQTGPNRKPSMQSSGGMGYVRGTDMKTSSSNNPSNVRDVSRPSSPEQLKPGGGGGGSDTFAEDNDAQNAPSRSPSSSGSLVNPSYAELFESNTPVPNPSEGGKHPAVESGSVSFPSSNGPQRAYSSSANMGEVSFPDPKDEPRPKYLDNPISSVSRRNAVPL